MSDFALAMLQRSNVSITIVHVIKYSWQVWWKQKKSQNYKKYLKDNNQLLSFE